MYVKLFNKILDSSIAEDRRLRHFFTDLLLLADPDGNVCLTTEAISRRTKAPMDEVEWGLKELSKPDKESFTSEEQGRRIVPLDGHGYGWKIINFIQYRDWKTAGEMRASTAERVARYRARKKKRGAPLPGEGLLRNGTDSGEIADMVNRERVGGEDL
jgi:hypothetical protein